MADIFVSYARADRARVAPLVAALESQGFTVWWDPAITPGQEFDQLIRQELDAARAVVVVWTPSSVDSRWVRGEARLGAERGILVPVRFDNARLPIDVLTLQTIDLDDWTTRQDRAALEPVMRALRGLVPPSILSPSPPMAAQAIGRSEVSIAVLPFVNMSSDAEQEYFSDGLSEELINQLAQIKELRVAGRTSSFAFKGKTEDLRGIGQRLGVSHVLEGSVRRAGKRLRITAQLIKCTDGFHLWSNKFDRELADVFDIQDEIAGAVASALKVTLGIGQTVRTLNGTDNVEAFDLILRARSNIRAGEQAAALRGLELARKAVEIDPTFALGWCVLANALTSALLWQPENADLLQRQLNEALERAIALAPDLWTAHEARADQLELQGDWVGAEKANARSRALAPRSERAPLSSRAHQLAAMGRVSEAIPFLQEAVRIEPLMPHGSLPFLLDLVGRHDEAENEVIRTQDLIVQRAAANSFNLLRRMASKDRTVVKAYLAEKFTEPGSLNYRMGELFDDRDRALDALRHALEADGPMEAGVTMVGYWAAYLDDPQLALDVFRRRAANLFAFQLTHIWHPLLADMRRLPAFKDLVRDLNIVSYWRTTGNWGEFARPLGDDDFEIIK